MQQSISEDYRKTDSGSGISEVKPNSNKYAKQGTETTVERTDDEQRKADSGRVVDDTAERVEGDRDRSDIRVFEEGLDDVRSIHSDDSERDRRQAESERLVDIAKQNGRFIISDETKQLGVKEPKNTGESVVYINDEQGKVYKVKDPYAKSILKNGVQPEDAIYEHIIHNLLFPETRYRFEGISEGLGDVRIVLSQNLIESVGQPTKEQITEALTKKSIVPRR